MNGFLAKVRICLLRNCYSVWPVQSTWGLHYLRLFEELKSKFSYFYLQWDKITNFEICSEIKKQSYFSKQSYIMQQDSHPQETQGQKERKKQKDKVFSMSGEWINKLHTLTQGIILKRSIRVIRASKQVFPGSGIAFWLCFSVHISIVPHSTVADTDSTNETNFRLYILSTATSA